MSTAGPGPVTALLPSRGHGCRLESLRLAVDLYARRGQDDFTGQAVLHAAGEFLEYLTARPAALTVGDPVITVQGSPSRRVPLNRTGADMAVTMTDGDQATYPAPSETDSKGYPVTGDTITVTSTDTAAAVVTQTVSPDGSVTFAGVGPGAATITWTDGTLSFSDTINVTSGAAAALVVGAPVVSAQPAAAGA